jgi:hypothetical protein
MQAPWKKGFFDESDGSPAERSREKDGCGPIIDERSG